MISSAEIPRVTREVKTLLLRRYLVTVAAFAVLNVFVLMAWREAVTAESLAAARREISVLLHQSRPLAADSTLKPPAASSLLVPAEDDTARAKDALLEIVLASERADMALDGQKRQMTGR